MKMKRPQGGFTMIELIMVIVILGVLSAFALPKFANLTGDAEAAALDGALAAMKSGKGIVRAAYLAAGSTNPTLEGQLFTMVNGHVGGTEIDEAAGFVCGAFGTANAAADFDCTAAGTTTIVSLEGAIVGDTCILYTEAADASTPPTFTMGTVGGTFPTATCT